MGYPAIMQPQAQRNNAQITPTFVNGSVYDPTLLCLDKEEFCFCWHGAHIEDFARSLLFKPMKVWYVLSLFKPDGVRFGI